MNSPTTSNSNILSPDHHLAKLNHQRQKKQPAATPKYLEQSSDSFAALSRTQDRFDHVSFKRIEDRKERLKVKYFSPKVSVK